ncbi:MAG: MBL fold metallo-hydrolase, partial [Candidatus Thermoplasmatota archaeon]
LINTDVTIQHGDNIQIGDEMFTVIHTPGHSPGSICLYSPYSKILISGDTVFSDGGFGRFDLPGGDIHQLARSIKNLTTLEVKQLYPGHGYTVPEEGDKHIKKSWLNLESMMI